MSYDTLYFALFFALVYTLWLADIGRGHLLLAASVLFYAVAGWRDSAIAAAILVLNFGASFLVARDRRFLPPAIVLNVACLAFFKYRAFLLGEVAQVDLFVDRIVIPLGISFYIFQLIAYQVDVATGRATLVRSFPQFALFKLYFAQLVAGPITRASKLAPQIARVFARRLPARKMIGLALGLCVLGLFKKIVLADSIAPHADAMFRGAPGETSAAWLGAYLFGFQIYYDFSGYSDIALGLALLCGIRLPVNFSQPYLAASPQEFWRRWHITLSTWIRDYLYIPLGGNRGGWLRQAAVLLAVMGLAGLWHGANWTFLVWGLGWAVVIVVWRHARPALARLGLLQWLFTLIAVFVLWVFFRAPDLAAAVAHVSAMFGFTAEGGITLPDDGAGGWYILAGALALLALQPLERFLFDRRALYWFRRNDGAFLRAMLVGFALLMVVMMKSNTLPFIYFRF